MINVDNNVDVFVQDWGSGNPVFLVHGWPLSSRMFEYQIPALVTHGFRVVAMDLRGYGLSSTPWAGNDYDTWADDIGRVIRALGLQNVTLVGFSLGGAIAAHYVATDSTSRVSKLLLCAAAAPCMIKKADNPNGVPAELWNDFIEAEITDRAKFKHTFNANFFATPVSPELSHWFEAIGMEVDAHASLRGLEELRDRDLRSELGKIRVPTRILHGVNDRVVPFGLGVEQQRLIAGSELVRFERSGHGLFFDEKDKFTAELLRVLGEPVSEQIVVPVVA
jgi:non-heme chloroperoxidase